MAAFEFAELPYGFTMVESCNSEPVAYHGGMIEVRVWIVVWISPYVL